MTNDQAVYEDSSPVCMANGEPVSIYDLAGLQISADNGSTVYLVVSNVSMIKMDIMGENYNTNIWLPISIAVLSNLSTSSTTPKITTEVATLGDKVSTFKILQMNQTSVEGNVTIEFPVCCSYESGASILVMTLESNVWEYQKYWTSSTTSIN